MNLDALLCLAVAAFAAVVMLFCGCAYNNVEIYAGGNVNCHATVDKPTTVDTLRGAKGEVGLMP